MNTIKARDPKDAQLLKGVLKADPASVKSLYTMALPSVIYWIKENNGNEADARDIFQEALLALYRRLESGNFELTCSLKSYIRVCCHNLWRTRLRDGKPLSPLEDMEERVELDATVQTRLEQSERHRLFQHHFDRLEEGCQKILALFFEKIPLSEIAGKMGTSLAYIKKRKFLCKERLVEAIQADPHYEELLD